MTDRRGLSTSPEVATKLQLEKIKEAAAAGVDWVQLREKDFSGRQWAEFASEALRSAAGKSTVLINDRLDVARALRADGVHLGERGLAVKEARRFVKEVLNGENFLIGVSVHSLEDAFRAQEGGASYVIFGPIFSTPSKAGLGQPQGLARLQDVCSRLRIPVLAIGGITVENAQDCFGAGASGIAAIRMFQEARDLSALVKELRGKA